MENAESEKSELTYDELILGENALNLYLDTLRGNYSLIRERYGNEAEQVAREGVDSVRRWNAINLPTFLNRREVYRTRDGTVLTTTDLVIAQVLGGVNGFLMSDAGSGKSQLITDIARYYFGGDFKEGGHSVIKSANNDFRISALLEERVEDKPHVVELSGAHKACFFGIDELTRAHPMVANEFSDLGNGVYHRGKFNVCLGNKGYFVVVATGNDPRKIENRGAMEWDGSMMDRFPFFLNLGSDRFGIFGTEDDTLKLQIKPPKTGIFHCTPRDLTDKIIGAYNQICSTGSDLGSEVEAVFYFLSRGAGICPGRNGKEPPARKKSLIPIAWPRSCIECSKSKVSVGVNTRNSLCSLVNTENGRTLTNARRYASALDFLLKLKARDEGREIDYNPADIAFLSFELCGALQEGVLNKDYLGKNYPCANDRMMGEVVAMLKEEFNRHGEMFITELEGIRTFGRDYSILERGGELVASKQIPKKSFSRLKEGIKLVIPSYSSGEVSWDFAPRVIEEKKSIGDLVK